MPGWTDTMGILQQAVLQIGLGVVRDLHGDGGRIVDLIPVDFVAKTLLVSIPFMINQVNINGDRNLLITHCTTSSTVPVNWSTFLGNVVEYSSAFPLDKRVGKAALTIHPVHETYVQAYKYKNQLPTNALFYLSKVLGGKQRKLTTAQTKDAVYKSNALFAKFSPFMLREWIHDASSRKELIRFSQ